MTNCKRQQSPTTNRQRPLTVRHIPLVNDQWLMIIRKCSLSIYTLQCWEKLDLWEGCEESRDAPLQKFFNFELRMARFDAFWERHFEVELPVLHT